MRNVFLLLPILAVFWGCANYPQAIIEEQNILAQDYQKLQTEIADFKSQENEVASRHRSFIDLCDVNDLKVIKVFDKTLLDYRKNPVDFEIAKKELPDQLGNAKSEHLLFIVDDVIRLDRWRDDLHSKINILSIREKMLNEKMSEYRNIQAQKKEDFFKLQQLQLQSQQIENEKRKTPSIQVYMPRHNSTYWQEELARRQLSGQ